MKISHHALIRYIGLNGLTPKEIHKDMVVALGENAPSYNMVKKWAVEFIHGRESGKRPPSGKASHHHHTGDHYQDSWDHQGNQTSNRALHCHWVGYLPGTHPCSLTFRVPKQWRRKVSKGVCVCVCVCVCVAHRHVIYVPI